MGGYDSDKKRRLRVKAAKPMKELDCISADVWCIVCRDSRSAYTRY
jgi:hypothetical protein